MEHNCWMEVSANACYYPKAGCFMIGGILHCARNVVGEKKSIWEILRQPGGVKVERHTFNEEGRAENSTVYIWSSNLQQHMLILKQGRATSVTLDSTIDGIRPMVCVWKIQQAIRNFLWRRRAISFAMGLHNRLGAGSRVIELDSDLLALVLK